MQRVLEVVLRRENRHQQEASEDVDEEAVVVNRVGEVKRE